MAITSSFANLATVTRASKAWDPGAWDFTSGGTVGALVEYAANTARTTSAGLVVEEGSTNENRNPRAEGATVGVLGSGGAMPTNWAASGGTREVIGTGTDDGWPYLDLKITGSSNCTIYTEGSSVISAASGEDWTASCGFKVVAGSLTNVSIGFGINQIGAASAFPQNFITGTLGATHRRFAYSKTLDASTTNVRPFIVVYAGGAIDVTLRIYAPQIEQLSYPTSPILPTAASPAASTRAADDISLPFGSWGGSSHTVFVEYTPNVITKGSDGTVMDISDGTSSNRIGIRHDNSTGYPEGIVLVGGSFVAAPIGASSLVLGTPTKIAIAVAADDVAFSTTGETQATDSSTGSIFTPTEVQIGAAFNGTASASGYIKDLRYFPRRLSNAELETMVGN